jgi:outer membrane protein assembly factor BamE (lipoprotein component of BamABCDE complex)
MRAVFAVLLLLPLSACELVYKLPTRQGNVIEQKELDQLKLGMTRDQVRFVLGTPVATSGLRDDRWDYFGYYKPPRGKPFSRTVSLYFQGDALVRMEGEQPVKNGSDKPDLETLENEQKKAATEEERAKEKTDSGIIIQQPKQP